MAFTKTQTGVANSAVSGTTVLATFASNPGTGHLVCVGLLFFDGGTTPPTYTVQDGNGNTYTNEAHTSGATNMDTAGWVGMAYLANTPSNAEKNITVTFNRTIAAAVIWIDEFQPSTGTPTYDNGAFANGTSAITTPSIPVAGANELVYAVACDADTVTAVSSAWTLNQGGLVFGCGAEWILDVSAATAVGFSGSAGNVYNAVGMSFKMVTATGGGGPLVNNGELVNGSLIRGGRLAS